MIYDLIVVGSGSIGAATAWYAKQAGLQVLMIDAHHPPHKQGSHHGETRLIRYAYSDGEHYLPLLLDSKQRWLDLEKISQCRLLTQCGVLHLAAEDSPTIRQKKRIAQQWQLNCLSLSAEDIHQRWLGLTPPAHFSGLLEQDAGYLHCSKAVQVLIKLCHDAGCAQLFNSPVMAINQHSGLQQVKTAQGIFQAHRLVISAGTQVRQLLPSLPVQPVRKVFTWFQADGRYGESAHFPAFTIDLGQEGQFYGFPAQNASLKLARHDGGQPLTVAQQPAAFGQIPSDGSECLPVLRQFLPGVGGCLNGESCLYDNSPDQDFIIDTLPDNPHCLLITGLSGHGFKFALTLGHIASEFAGGQVLSDYVSHFSLRRFNESATNLR